VGYEKIYILQNKKTSSNKGIVEQRSWMILNMPFGFYEFNKCLVIFW
jgi:hypothetical protein